MASADPNALRTAAVAAQAAAVEAEAAAVEAEAAAKEAEAAAKKAKKKAAELWKAQWQARFAKANAPLSPESQRDITKLLESILEYQRYLVDYKENPGRFACNPTRADVFLRHFKKYGEDIDIICLILGIPLDNLQKKN